MESLGFYRNLTIQDTQAATRLLHPQPLTSLVRISNPNFTFPSPIDRCGAPLKHFSILIPKFILFFQFITFRSNLNVCAMPSVWTALERYVIHRRNIQLGLWVIVLEKIVKNRTDNGTEDHYLQQYKASMVDEFLHGPALAGFGWATIRYNWVGSIIAIGMRFQFLSVSVICL